MYCNEFRTGLPLGAGFFEGFLSNVAGWPIFDWEWLINDKVWPIFDIKRLINDKIWSIYDNSGGAEAPRDQKFLNTADKPWNR
jgi:hypothetical protein